jgi:hypothetical protein
LKRKKVIPLTNENAEGMDGSRLDQIDTGSIQEGAKHLAGDSTSPTRKGGLDKAQKTAPL